MTYSILQGSALDVLKTLDSESVQTCITSPPYYGLRSYGTEPQVWGNHNGCSHEFDIQTVTDRRGTEGTTLNGRDPNQQENRLHYQHGFCLSCNAWRGELGLEPTFQLYISHLIEIFGEVKRVLKKDGAAFVNLGDSYSGDSPVRSVTSEQFSETWDSSQTRTNGGNRRSQVCSVPRKSLMNIPARFAIAMTDELKMIQRNEIIWYKRACMPSSAKDRFTVDFEKIFFFSKEPRYKFNQQLERTITFDTNLRDRDTTKLNNTPGKTRSGGLVRNDYEFKNKRCVWDVPFEPSGDEHYASYPTKLVEPMILAGTDEGDTVLDIFNGTATTGLTALRNRRNYIGIELNEKYIDISKRRLAEVQVKLF